ncbi:MAG: TIGR02265 family protein, partial [Archangium sp.]
MELVSTRSANSYDWKHDCEMRLVHVGPQDTVRGLFLNGTLETIRLLGGEQVAKDCLEACGQERFVDVFSYSIGLQLRMISVAMPSLMTRVGSCELVLWQLGRRAAMDFLQSTAGKMLLTLARKEPKRLVNSLPSAYKASVSYGTQQVEWSGPKSGRVIMKREFMPHAFHSGMVEMLLEMAGATGVKV